MSEGRRDTVVFIIEVVVFDQGKGQQAKSAVSRLGDGSA